MARDIKPTTLNCDGAYYEETSDNFLVPGSVRIPAMFLARKRKQFCACVGATFFRSGGLLVFHRSADD